MSGGFAAFGADPCEGAGPRALRRDIFETKKGMGDGLA
jgi:hypothetical protein